MSDSNEAVKRHTASRQFRFETETVAVVDQMFYDQLSR